MSTQDPNSKRFAKYCQEGKMHLVKKWFDTVDVNYQRHMPLRNAIKTNQTEIVKYLLTHLDLKTDYENDHNPKIGTKILGDKRVNNIVINPFTDAMLYRNFDILDIFGIFETFDIFGIFDIFDSEG